MLIFARPLETKAGFFDSLLNNKVYGALDASFFGASNNNSQTMPLLKANVSSLEIIQGKNSKDSKENKVNQNETINIIAETSLLPNASPMSPVGGSDIEDYSVDQTSVYVVRKGDTLSEIADMFGVSVNTILSANDMKKGETVKEGDVLLILPFSAIEHTVTKGQTLKSIATLYKADLNAILLANDIELTANLTIGQKLVIPDAEMLDEPETTKSNTKNLATGKRKNSVESLPSVSGFFKNPVPGAKRTRGIKPGHRGVDLAAPTGTPIYAAASGKVLKAGMGYNGGFGNMVIIQHSNGCKTLYAHMSKLGSTSGETVNQGDIIGYVGSTGRSTGPHLHIETIGCKNPF